MRLVLLGAVALATPGCWAQDPATSTSPAQTLGRDRGIQYSISQLSDWSVVASGGVRSGRGVFRSLWDLELDIDGEALLGLPGSRFYADAQLQRGRDGSLDSGDFQVYSNIDGPNREALAQVFYEQEFGGGAVRLRLGKFDANTDFAMVVSGVEHVHSSFGFAPTIVGLPTYPDPAFGGALFVSAGGYYVRGALQDGATQAGIATGDRGPGTLFGSPSDLFTIVEAGLEGDGLGSLPGRFAGGWWHHTGSFDGRDGDQVHGLAGVYALAEQVVWQPAAASDEDGSGLAVFAQYGHVDARGSIVENYYGCGATWTGFCAQRPHDQLGVGVAWAEWRTRPGGGVRGGGEVATELFYRAQVTPSLVVMPDVQFVHDPGGRPELRDALVFTLRIALSF